MNYKSNINNLDRKAMSMLSLTLLTVISVVLMILFNTYNRQYKVILGFLILVFSVMLLANYRRDKLYSLLFATITYINLSILLSDCLTDGGASLPYNTLIWQIYRGTYYELVFLKALLLFMMILNFCMLNIRKVQQKNILKNRVELINNNNSIVFFIGYIIMVVGLFAGYDITRDGGYSSNSNALYEYCIMFFLLSWMYAGRSKKHHIMLILYAIAYIGQAVLFGDRSAAFPMLMLAVILYYKSLSIFQVIFLSLAGIIVANIISVYRLSYSLRNFNSVYIARYGLMSITSDTVSQSYYTGVSLIAVKESIGNTAKYFIDFIIGIFLGGGYGDANVVTLGKQYATNKGGGLVISSFYFWFGYIGIVFLALIIGLLLQKLIRTEGLFTVAWKTYLTVSVFRWYLYNSFVFFRGVIFVFPVMYLLFKIMDAMIKAKPLIINFRTSK